MMMNEFKLLKILNYLAFQCWAYLIKVIPEARRAHQNWYLRFHYYHWVDTSSGGLLVSEGIISPRVSDSVLTWFIRYIYYWNLQFL